MRSSLVAVALLTAAACAAAPEDSTGKPAPLYGVVTPDGDDRTAELYAPGNVPRFDLELPPAAIAALRADPRREVRATFRYRDEVVADIGVRLKGEGSFRPVDAKPSFRIKFDEFVAKQKFRGLSRMVLNNTVQDPSFLSERLAYAVYRAAGQPAPRANSALVFVNDEYFGVYTNVEAVDKAFLRRWFANHEGNLYEETGADFVPGAESAFELETNEDANDRSGLAALNAVLARATPADFMEVVGPHLDIQRFVNFAALEALTGQEDGYSFRQRRRNNFRVYEDPASGTFAFIPSGMDRALRPQRAPTLVHDWVPAAPVYDSPWDAQGIVLQKCVAAPACRAEYAAALEQSTKLFEAMNLAAEVDRLAAQIRGAVRADRRKELDNRYFEYALGTMKSWISGRPASIRAP